MSQKGKDYRRKWSGWLAVRREQTRASGLLGSFLCVAIGGPGWWLRVSGFSECSLNDSTQRTHTACAGHRQGVW